MGPEAIAAATAISALVGAGATVYSAYQKGQAAEEAEKIAEKNAQRTELETEEAARRLERQQERNQSLAKARAAASGAGGASVDTYLDDMEAEDERQLNWLKKSGASQAEIQRWEGRATAKAGRAGAIAGMIGGAADMFSAGTQFDW